MNAAKLKAIAATALVIPVTVGAMWLVALTKGMILFWIGIGLLLFVFLKFSYSEFYRFFRDREERAEHERKQRESDRDAIRRWQEAEELAKRQQEGKPL